MNLILLRQQGNLIALLYKLECLIKMLTHSLLVNYLDLPARVH